MINKINQYNILIITLTKDDFNNFQVLAMTYA